MWNKIKDAFRLNKAAAVTGVTLLVSLGIIVGVTAAANRAVEINAACLQGKSVHTFL